jgi:hypothetical protein
LPAISVQPPFTGIWDKYGVANPRNHNSVAGGDWAADLYRAPNSVIKVRAYPTSGRGAVRYYVAAETSACRSRTDGGRAVKIDFYISSTKVGSAWYLHLANVPTGVRAGAWLSHGAVLGYTSRFTRSPCYDVPDDAGVHIHFELISDVHWACYINRRSGTSFEYYGVIGRIGGEYARGPRAACP